MSALYALYCEADDDHQWVADGYVDESGFTFSDHEEQVTCPICGAEPATHDPLP